MVFKASFVALASILAASLVAAHPGEHEPVSELAARAEYFSATARSIAAACANSPDYLAVREAAVKRRSEFLSQLGRQAMKRRSLSTALATNHKSNLTGLAANTDPSTLFGTSPKCLLAPETTEGPYFVAGEFIRTNLIDNQAGLPLYLDLQFLDSSTCKVLPTLYINVWHANSTGVYSGIVASGNGNSNDKSNAYKTNNRGIYPTDSNGVVQFTTTFPGHYTGRTTHIHLSTASGGTVLANNTYINAKYSHVGQVFFDQEVINAVEKLSPYSTNTQTLTLNSVDSVLATAAANTFDPILNYAYVNDDITQGILAWVTIAVDTSKSVSVKVAATYAGDGSPTPSPSPAGVSSSPSPTKVPASSSPSPSTSASVSPSPTASLSEGASPSTTPSASSSPAVVAASPAAEASSVVEATPSPSSAATAGEAGSGSFANTVVPAGASLLALLVAPLMM